MRREREASRLYAATWGSSLVETRGPWSGRLSCPTRSPPPTTSVGGRHDVEPWMESLGSLEGRRSVSVGEPA